MSLVERASALLEYPPLYLAYQFLVGGLRARRKTIREHIRPGAGLSVLDIGCGPGYAIESFPDPAYFGFDISPEYIRYARRRFSPPGKFFCQHFDETALEWLPPMDVVLMTGVLHHLDDATAVALLALALRAMKPSGRLFTLDGCYQEGQSAMDRYFLDRDRGRFIRRQSDYQALAGRVFPHVSGTVRKDLFLIPQTTLIMECSR